MSMSRKIAIGKGWQLKDGKLVPCYSAVAAEQDARRIVPWLRTLEGT